MAGCHGNTSKGVPQAQAKSFIDGAYRATTTVEIYLILPYSTSLVETIMDIVEDATSFPAGSRGNLQGSRFAETLDALKLYR